MQNKQEKRRLVKTADKLKTSMLRVSMANAAQAKNQVCVKGLARFGIKIQEPYSGDTPMTVPDNAQFQVELESKTLEEALTLGTKFIPLVFTELCDKCGIEKEEREHLLNCHSCLKSWHKGCVPKETWPDKSTPFCCFKCSDKTTEANDTQAADIRCKICKNDCQFAASECSICLDVRHLECLRVPLKYLLASGTQARAFTSDFDSAQLLGYKLVQGKAVGDEPSQFYEEEKLEKHGVRLCTRRNLLILDYVCKICVNQRSIDQFLDFHDCSTKRTITSLQDYDDEDFTETLKQRCYYKVRLAKSSYVHTVWLSYDVACESTKFMAFHRKLASWHTELNSVGSLLNDLEGKLRSQAELWPNPEIILSLYWRQETKTAEAMIRAEDWKYCLVKWCGQEYDESTWELTQTMCRMYGQTITDLLKEFENRQRTMFLAQHNAKYRTGLMKGRNQALRSPAAGFVRQEQSDPLAVDFQMASSSLSLLDHQRKGVHWLLQSWREGRNVMLADEMGLGKTIQAIALLKELMCTYKVTRPFLISVPLSTIENWRREFKLWCPEARLITYLGRVSSRKIIRDLDWHANLKSMSGEVAVPNFNVLLTSYEFLRTDFNQFVKTEWQCFIIDEGQKMKNNNSSFFRKCAAVHAQFKVLLSGTPLQNNIEELYNLIEFLDPVKFGAAFKTKMHELRTVNILSKDDPQLNNANPEAAQGNEQKFTREETFFSTLQTALKPHLLRRFKREVLKELPLRKEVIVRIEMTQEQKDLARSLLEQNLDVLVAFERGKQNGGQLSGVNNLFVYMRQIVNHTLLLGSEYATENFRSKKLCRELNLPVPQTLDDFLRTSAKLQYLNVILDRILVDHKVLIFSQFVGMLNLLGDFLAMKGLKSLRIDGSMNMRERQVSIDRFNDPSYRIFLLSTKAGGLGINLTQADTVIIFDSDFNPHNDQQALSRAHRIGQKNNVIVYRLICKDSVEERIMEQAKKKMMLDTAVQQNSKEMVLKVLRFGTAKLFSKLSKEKEAADNEVRKEYEVDLEALDKLLDRDTQFHALIEEQKAGRDADGDQQEDNGGVFDYLSQFKVADIQNKGKALPIQIDLLEVPDIVEDKELIDDVDDPFMFEKIYRQKQAEELAKVLAEQEAIVKAHAEAFAQAQLEKQAQELIIAEEQKNKPATFSDDMEISSERNIEMYEEKKVQVDQASLQKYQKTQVHQYLQAVTEIPKHARLSQYEIYHDYELAIQRKTSPISPTKLQVWQVVLDRLTADESFPRIYLPLITLNCLDLGQKKFPQELYLFGLNSAQIFDFTAAFMDYSVQKKQFHRFYQKLSEACAFIQYEGKPLTENYLSLSTTSEFDFINFARYWSEFQQSLLMARERHLDLRLTEKAFVFFGNRSLDEVAFRSYTIYLLSELVSAEGHREASTVPFNSWNDDCDVILAELTVSLGFTNMSAISQHPVWHYLLSSIPGRLMDLISQSIQEERKGKKSWMQGLAQLLMNMSVSDKFLAQNFHTETTVMRQATQMIEKIRSEIQELLSQKLKDLVQKLRKRNLEQQQQQ